MKGALDRLADRVLRASPVLGLVVFSVPGVLLLALSLLVRVALVPVEWPLLDDACRVTGEYTREVGYFAALSWSVSLVLIFPLFVYIAIELVQAMDRSFEQLRERRMVVDGRFEPLETDAVKLVWRRRLKLLFRWGLPSLLAFTLLMSIDEWRRESLRLLRPGGFKETISRQAQKMPGDYADGCTGSDRTWCEEAAQAVCMELELDWGSASVIPTLNDPPQWIANAGFSLLAFVWQAVCFALVFLFVGLSAVYASVVGGFSRGVTDKSSSGSQPDAPAGDGTVRLMPQLASRDPRRGFELFEPILQLVLLASGSLFLAFYLSRLQNSYLRTNLDVGNILQFIFKDIMISWFKVHLDQTSLVVTMVTLILLVTAVLVTFVTVGRSASRIRDALADHLAVAGIDAGDARLTRLAKMRIWPHNYITLNWLILAIVSAVLCLLYYKIGVLYVAGIGVVAIVHTLRAHTPPDAEKAILRPETLRVFISYAHEDEEHRRALEAHLATLKRLELIEAWDDRKIEAGHEWAQEIDSNLDAANMVLLLVSADFIASDYCFQIEMNRALERQDAKEARVIPIIVRDVEWAGLPFGKLQALPREARPISRWNDPDEAWASVARGIRRAAESMLGRAADGT